MYRNGVRRLLVQVMRTEGDVRSGGGSFGKKEKVIEDQWIQGKEKEALKKKAEEKAHPKKDDKKGGKK